MLEEKENNPEEDIVSEQDTVTETSDKKVNKNSNIETIEDSESPSVISTKKNNTVQKEIDESNAEDAEDAQNLHRHQIPVLDYNELTLEKLVGEIQRLVRNEKVQAIRKHVEGIKSEFDLKFQDHLEQKKEEFLTNGGNEIDFKYSSVAKRQFNEVYSEYREKRNQHYKNLEKDLKNSLANRLSIIEELKGLVNMEEDINTTYKSFKDLQDKWRAAGPIPRVNYNDVWRTYHHHIEIFYDFLHLNRELRDLDFKNNLEEKQKLIARAEGLAEEHDLNKAFRELQTLHKIWKEDIGPVSKEHRDGIWERFGNATRALHQRRQEYFKDLDKVYEENLVRKKDLITKIETLSNDIATSHRGLQLQMKELETLREAFFKAGKVPQKDNEKTWTAFKTTVRSFNRNKNAFYKNLKKDQQENLDKKQSLLELANSLKDSEDWDMATAEMKRVQSEWKKIGHVPRKYSDSIWSDFKNACNHYFKRLHASKNKTHEGEVDNYEQKKSCLEKLKVYELQGDTEADISYIKELIKEWRAIGKVPFTKKNINSKFNTILDALFKKLEISSQESELLKYGNKIQQLARADNDQAISKERTFIKRKIHESKNEIRQLENNLEFFSEASEDNPLVQDVIRKIERNKEALDTWKAKLKKLNILENNLNRDSINSESEDPGASEQE